MCWKSCLLLIQSEKRSYYKIVDYLCC